MDWTVKPSTRLGTPPSTTFARCSMTCCPTFQIRTCEIKLITSIPQRHRHQTADRRG